MAPFYALARSVSANLKVEPALEELVTSVQHLVACQACAVLLAERGRLVCRASFGTREWPAVRLGEGAVGAAVERGRVLVSDGLLWVPLRLRGHTLGCLVLEGEEWSARAVDLLHALAQQGAVTVENARLYEERDRVTQLLRSTLIPESLSAPGVEVAHLHLASQTLSGDYYDLFAAGERLVVAIADVAGKGPEAGIHTVPIKFILRSHALLGAGPAEILARLNAQLLDLSPVTVFCGVLEKGRLRYARAGHEPPLLWTPTGIAPLDADGILLGALPDASFEEREVDCPPGSCLLLYTDGLTEARATWGGAFFGLAPVRAALEEHGARGARAVVDRLAVEVSRFTRDLYTDDLSILALRF